MDHTFEFIPEKLSRMRPMLGFFARIFYSIGIIILVAKYLYGLTQGTVDNPIYWGIIYSLMVLMYLVFRFTYRISLTPQGFTQRTLNLVKSHDWSDFKMAEWTWALNGSVALNLVTLDDKIVKIVGSSFEHETVFSKIFELYQSTQLSAADINEQKLEALKRKNAMIKKSHETS